MTGLMGAPSPAAGFNLAKEGWPLEQFSDEPKPKKKKEKKERAAPPPKPPPAERKILKQTVVQSPMAPRRYRVPYG